MSEARSALYLATLVGAGLWVAVAREPAPVPAKTETVQPAPKAAPLPKPAKQKQKAKPKPKPREAFCDVVRREYARMTWAERMAAYRRATPKQVKDGRRCLGM